MTGGTNQMGINDFLLVAVRSYRQALKWPNRSELSLRPGRRRMQIDGLVLQRKNPD